MAVPSGSLSSVKPTGTIFELEAQLKQLDRSFRFSVRVRDPRYPVRATRFAADFPLVHERIVTKLFPKPPENGKILIAYCPDHSVQFVGLTALTGP